MPLHEEPKALADFLRAAAILSSAGRHWAQPFVSRLSARLIAGGDERSWGIGFPYVSRFVNVPALTPNAYTTISVGESLFDAAEHSGDARSLEAAAASCRFVVDELGSFSADGQLWQRYWPGAEDRIINVQALAASILARAATVLDDDNLRARADEAVATTLATQRSDGAWPYGADERGEFVDGFHTGFVLQALAEYAARRPGSPPEVQAALERGMEFFRAHLLAPEGLPLGFADGRVTDDSQTVAQCVQTLLIAGDDDAIELAGQVWGEMHRRGLSPLDSGRGYESLRWSLGPGVLAAARLWRAGTT